MARPRAIDRIDREIVERIRRRPRWQVVLLAEVLECDRQTIYNYIWDGRLKLGPDGKIEAGEVLKLLEGEKERA